MKKNITKIIASLMILAVIIASVPAASFAATWKTGNIPPNYKNSSYTTVHLSNPKKSAKIKIHTYWTYPWSSTGHEGNSRLYITMRTTSGAWIWGGTRDTGRHGVTLKLGNDHAAYRICVREVKVPDIWYYEDYYQPDYYAIECRKNCYI